MEVFLLFGLVLVLVLWSRSYRGLFQVHSFRPNKTHRTILAILPAICVSFIAVVLLKKASPDVRPDASWITLYVIGGAAWLQLGLFLLSLFGIGVREDVLERQNPAAGWVVYGTLIGTALCYAGANVGSGSGPEVVLICAVLSTAFLFCSWICLERIFRLVDRVTIERDEDAGIRSGGWLVSLGLVFGGAVAGNWHSVEGTIDNFFHDGWVALLFLLGAIAIEWAFKSAQKRENQHRRVSVAIAVGYFLAAATYVARRGVH